MEFFAPLFDPANLPGLLTLSLLEIVLGIDNVIFITILAGKLPQEQQRSARQIGLAVALISRIALLFAISWVMTLTKDLFTMPVLNQGISGKDIILIVGGLLGTGKAGHENYENGERPDEHQPQELDEKGAFGDAAQKSSKNFFASFLVQVVLLDVVFSLDSVITAVGIVGDASKLVIMVVAVILAVIVMMLGAGPIGDFVQKHASVRVLALAFLVLIGFLLLGEGFEQHIEKGYVYFAMAFALGIEFLNMRMRSRAQRLAARNNKS